MIDIGFVNGKASVCERYSSESEMPRGSAPDETLGRTPGLTQARQMLLCHVTKPWILAADSRLSIEDAASASNLHNLSTQSSPATSIKHYNIQFSHSFDSISTPLF